MTIMMKNFFLIPFLVWLSIFDNFPLNASHDYLPSSQSKTIPKRALKRKLSHDVIFFYDQITIGLLHSLSGTMAISEKTLVEAEILAIEEINNSGGILVNGKRYEIKYILEDGQSDWPTFARKANKLITVDRVPVVFGGWTSASRKAMLPVFELYDSLLFYPNQYEGQECSNNIFYTGATPNQQSEPATDFMYKRSPAAGGNFFLVGSDYVFP